MSRCLPGVASSPPLHCSPCTHKHRRGTPRLFNRRSAEENTFSTRNRSSTRVIYFLVLATVNPTGSLSGTNHGSNPCPRCSTNKVSNDDNKMYRCAFIAYCSFHVPQGFQKAVENKFHEWRAPIGRLPAGMANTLSSANRSTSKAVPFEATHIPPSESAHSHTNVSGKSSMSSSSTDDDASRRSNCR